MTSYDSSTTKLRSPNVPAKLAYNGELIHDRGDMLSLTDMWRAAGSDSVKAPAQWQRLSQAIEFIEHVGLIVGNSHNNLVKTGKRGGTFAHWQIALAYAKYLSPEFHVWCNTVVRERMEGKVVKPHGFELDAPARMAIGGIVKSVIRANLTDMVGELVEQAINSDPRRSAMDGMSVRQLLDEAKTAQKGRNVAPSRARG